MTPARPILRLPILLMLCTLVLAGSLRAEPSRFFRVLELYHGHVWNSSDRSAALQIDLDRSWRQRSVNDSTRDTSATFSKQLSGAARLDRRSDQGDTLRSQSTRLHAAAAIGQSSRGYWMHGYKPPRTSSFTPGQALEEFDTVLTGLIIDAAWQGQELSFFAPPSGVDPALSLARSLHLRTGYQREENIEPLIPDSFMVSQKYQDRSFTAQVAGDIRPGISMGRQRAVHYVFYAFDIEQALLRCGALRFPLSDKRLAALAGFLARHHSYTLRDHDRVQQFKTALDSLIATDEAADRDRFRYLSPFDIREILLHRTPPLADGLRVSLEAAIRLEGRGSVHALHYPPRSDFFADEPAPPDTTLLRTALLHDSRLEINAQWGRPLSQAFFLSVRVARPLFTRTHGLIGYSDGTIDWPVAARLHWDLELVLWRQSIDLFGMHLLTAHGTLFAQDIQATAIVPRTLPYRSGLSMALYFEDYFSIDLSCALYQSRGVDRSTVLFPTPWDRRLHGLRPGLTMNYRF